MLGDVSRRSVVAVAEVESRIDDYLRAAEAGETVVVIRNGNPVAALIPLTGDDPVAVPEDDSPDKGLAGLAGGWEDSDDLITQIEEARLSARRCSSD